MAKRGNQNLHKKYKVTDWSKKLYNKNFILFLLSTAQSSFGASFSGIALVFLVLQLTNSASAIAITLALKFLPSIFMPVVATFVDRIRLKTPLITGNFLRGFVLIFLYLGIRFSIVNIYSIYVMALVNGIVATIYLPAAESLIPSLVPKEQLERANGLLGVASRSTVLAGLLCGGVVVSFIGPSLSLFVEGVCYIIVGILLFFVCMPKHAASITKNTFIKDFLLGLKVVKSSQIILIIMFMTFLISAVISPMEVLLPMHMMAIGRGAFGYGVFMGFFITGMLVGSSIITFLGSRFKSSTSIIYAWLGVSISFAGLAFFNSFYLSLFWALLFGLSINILNTGIIVILQKIIPKSFRGRIFGIIDAVAQVGIPVSLFILSYIVKKITLSEIFICGMILVIGFSALWTFAIRKKKMNFTSEIMVDLE